MTGGEDGGTWSYETKWLHGSGGAEKAMSSRKHSVTTRRGLTRLRNYVVADDYTDRTVATDPTRGHHQRLRPLHQVRGDKVVLQARSATNGTQRPPTNN